MTLRRRRYLLSTLSLNRSNIAGATRRSLMRCTTSGTMRFIRLSVLSTRSSARWFPSIRTVSKTIPRRFHTFLIEVVEWWWWWWWWIPSLLLVNIICRKEDGDEARLLLEWIFLQMLNDAKEFFWNEAAFLGTQDSQRPWEVKFCRSMLMTAIIDAVTSTADAWTSPCLTSHRRMLWSMTGFLADC